MNVKPYHNNFRYGKGEDSVYIEPVKTLSWSPMTFVPVVKLSGITWNSISIRWKPPETSQVSDAEHEEAGSTIESRNYLDYITYYKLTRKTDDHEVIWTS